MRGRGTEPALSMVTISGPYNVKGARRHAEPPPHLRLPATERPTTRHACARRILSTLARRAYRRPVTDADLQDLLPFYNGRPDTRRASTLGIERALERLLVSPQFLFRVEHEPPGAPAGSAPTASATSSWRRACRSSSGAAFPDDELLDVAARGKLKDPGGARTAGAADAGGSARRNRW